MEAHILRCASQSDHRINMKHLLLSVAVCVALGIVAFGFQAQNTAPRPAQPAQAPRGGQAGPNADPYANNAAPGTTTFPLAAPAGKDSNARMVAPAGAVNTGPFDPVPGSTEPRSMLQTARRSGIPSS